MSTKPKYTFLPWARLGVANSILEADSDAGARLRAKIPVDLALSFDPVGDAPKSQTVHKDISIYGPGDIVGIDHDAVVKTEPQNWITNFEPNLLPYVEFYDEDFPWRYTPAKSTSDRLRPWIALVVLAEDEFEDVVNMKGRPLPAFKLAAGKNAADVFPRPAELWAWAHVHVNRDVGGSGLAGVLQIDPDLASSRLVSPRRLAPGTAYHAFVIPSFESGRLAGLGADVPADIVATKSAWKDGQAEFPYYFRWRFRTGALGDFEYLVRLLKPQPCDKRVGVRDIDVLHPGSNLPAIDTPSEIGGVLKLGGALKIPFDTLSDTDKAEVLKYDEWDDPYPKHPFQNALADLVNLADDYQAKSAAEANPDADPDPIVTSPIYGRWHALTDRLLRTRTGTNAPHRKNWVHELNLDPRWRVAAGLGTRVMQENQERYMDAAWQQAGDILSANRLLELARLGREAAAAIQKKHFASLDPARKMVMTAPVHRRVIANGVTVRHALEKSLVPRSAVTSAFRRVSRTRGRLARRLSMTAPGASSKVLSSLDSGAIVSVPEWGAMPGGITLARMRDALSVSRPGDPAITARQRAALLALFSSDRHGDSSVDALPMSPDFVARRRGAGAAPTRGRTDSPEAARFKTALKSAFALAKAPPAKAARQAMDLASASAAMSSALDPDHAVPKHYQAMVSIPSWIASLMAETFTPAMLYPEIDLPMYEALVGISSELFLPNINLIPQNSITLLETNQPFIESYMTGLNHEMARELLWREYPTDQRGSYFRQFWDVSGVYPGDPPPPDVREKFRDIPPLHTWSLASTLGDHNPRAAGGDDTQLVLVIRGELLKRYPNAVIFAIKAEWDVDGQGNFDRDKERLVTNLAEAEKAKPPKAKVRMPIFEARVKPDIFFIGFDLTALDARGADDDDAPTKDNAGWFFVLQERPGEPRFGLDEAPPAGTEPSRLVNWNSLTWQKVGTTVGSCVKLDKTITLLEYDEDLDQDNKANPEDAAAEWDPTTTSAELAYMLYQVPVMVAVHAWRMLP
jgi:hypothetical protein